jgi:hypothetical protein
MARLERAGDTGPIKYLREASRANATRARRDVQPSIGHGEAHTQHGDHSDE